MTCERADNPAEKADVASGIIEVIGGGVRPGEGAAIPNAAEDELCAMVGERRVGRVTSMTAVTNLWFRVVLSHDMMSVQYHMTHVPTYSCTGMHPSQCRQL